MLRKRQQLGKPKINMIPMIDMVFLLLTFFVLTFRFIIPEGDFNIQMSSMEQAPHVAVDTDVVQVRLLADENGRLAEIQLDGGRLDGEMMERFEMLRQRVSAIGLARRILEQSDLEVELFPDGHLRYEYLVRAITAITETTNNIKFPRERLGNLGGQ